VEDKPYIYLQLVKCYAILAQKNASFLELADQYTQKLVSEFPQNREAAESLFTLARAYRYRGLLEQEEGFLRKARERYQQLIHSYPDSRYARVAVEELNQIQGSPSQPD
jgi:outer membrane protein assembly factor BamD (BamD/ComL family)